MINTLIVGRVASQPMLKPIPNSKKITVSFKIQTGEDHEYLYVNAYNDIAVNFCNTIRKNFLISLNCYSVPKNGKIEILIINDFKILDRNYKNVNKKTRL